MGSIELNKLIKIRLEFCTNIWKCMMDLFVENWSPIRVLSSGKWYTVWIKISGPPSIKKLKRMDYQKNLFFLFFAPWWQINGLDLFIFFPILSLCMINHTAKFPSIYLRFATTKIKLQPAEICRPITLLTCISTPCNGNPMPGAELGLFPSQFQKTP